MMNKRTLHVVFKYAALLLIALGAILQTVAMLTVYEEETSYFALGSVLPTVAVSAVLLGALLGLLSALFGDKEQIETVSPFSSPIPALIASLGFLCAGVLLFLFSALPLALPASVFFILASLYSLLSPTLAKKENAASFSMLGIFPIVACALGAAYCYFDVSLEMNAPVKVMLQTACLTSMLYYTGEIRFLLGRAQKRFYLILAYISLASAALSAISAPLAYTLGRITRADYYALSLLSFALAFSILLRILPLKRAGAILEELPATNAPEQTQDASDTDIPEASVDTSAPSSDSEDEKETTEE